MHAAIVHSCVPDRDTLNEEADFSFLSSEQFRQQLRRFFRKACRHEAEDLVQGTLLAALHARGRFRGTGRPQDFVLGIARRTLFSRYRELSKESPQRNALSCHDEELDLTDGEADFAELRELPLETWVGELPEDLRKAITMFYWEQKTQAQIAQALGLPAGTVASRLRRAREQLRARFEQLP